MHQVAIVGAGPAGVIGYLVLRYEGLAAEQIVVVDGLAHPLDAWASCSSAIAQRSMRSETEGHFFATDFPGFALLDAIHELSPRPLLRSIVNRYHPSLAGVVTHGRALAHHYGLDTSIFAARVSAIERHPGCAPYFSLITDRGSLQARHVLLSLGHGPFRWPGIDPASRPDLAGALVHAYQPKDYTRARILVVGAGMAAVGEWVNGLRAGAEVVALRRRPELTEQALAAPRCAFGGSWLDRYHRLSASERSATLAALGRGSSPRPKDWKSVLLAGERSGRLQHMVGALGGLERAGDGVVALVRTQVGEQEVRADLVSAATGFRYGWREHPLVRDLVNAYGLSTYGDHLVLADDCTVPRVSVPGSVLAVSGPLARWAIPPADSFAAMKYAGRRFAEHALQRRSFGPHLRSWWGMVRAGWPYETEPCATP